MRRPWRKCSACSGTCYWCDIAWVCRECGAEWWPDHATKYAPPGCTCEQEQTCLDDRQAGEPRD